MCNLYSQTKGQQAIVALTKTMRDGAGNLPSLPGIFPDYAAPIVRTDANGVRELVIARWGMPSPPAFIKGRDPGVTNIRNAKSPHWRRWLGPASRCLVPFTSFSEFNKAEGIDIWFALDESRPLAFFAGVQVPQWTSVRKVKVGEEMADLWAGSTAAVVPAAAGADPAEVIVCQAGDLVLSRARGECLAEGGRVI